MAEASKGQVRKRALIHATGSGILAALLVVLLLKWQEAGGGIPRGALIVAALPVAWFFSQLAVLATGVPFATMAKKWDSLTGGQRFVLSIAILAITAATIGAMGLAFVT